MMGPCGFISCGKRTTLARNVNSGGGGGQGKFGKSLYLALSFAVNLKLL